MVDFSNPLDKYFQDQGIQNPTTEQRKEVQEQLADFVDSLFYDENGKKSALINQLPNDKGGIYIFYLKGICLPFFENYILYIGNDWNIANWFYCL